MVKKDRQRAAELFLSTCKEMGFVESCVGLGNLYLSSKGEGKYPKLNSRYYLNHQGVSPRTSEKHWRCMIRLARLDRWAGATTQDWCGRADSTAVRPTTTKQPPTSPSRATETSRTAVSTLAPCSCKGKAPWARTCRKHWTTQSKAAIWVTPGAVQTPAGYIRLETVYPWMRRKPTSTGQKPGNCPEAQHERSIVHAYSMNRVMERANIYIHYSFIHKVVEC